MIKNINSILENNKLWFKKSNDKYNIEFVSANPTGPMHVGHCRGAIYGDVLANLLKFNGNTVTKNIISMIMVTKLKFCRICFFKNKRN